MCRIRGILTFAVVFTFVAVSYAQEPVVAHAVRKLDGNRVFVKGNKWALVVGVNQLPMAPLKYCVKDAHVVSQILQQQGGYPEKQIITLVDNPAKPQLHPTAKNIMQELTAMLNKVDADDTVVVSFSGHGWKTVDANGKEEYYLIPIDFNGNANSAVEMKKLRELLEKSPARQKLLILDCCHAGGAKGLPQFVKQFAATNATPAELQSVFVNAKGIWTLTSCRAAETSLEWADKKHGLFTYFLADGLRGNADYDRDGFITVHELALYVLQHVSVTANDITSPPHLQNPDLIIPPENVGNMIVALAREQPQPQPQPQPEFDRAALRRDIQPILQASLNGQLPEAEQQAKELIRKWTKAGVAIPWELECLHGAVLLRLALEIVVQKENAGIAQTKFAEAENRLALALAKAPKSQSGLPTVLLARVCNNLAVNPNEIRRVQLYRRAHDLTADLLDPRAVGLQLDPQRKAQCHYLLWFVQTHGLGTGLNCVQPQTAAQNLNASLIAFRSREATNAREGRPFFGAQNGLPDLFSEFDDLQVFIQK